MGFSKTTDMIKKMIELYPNYNELIIEDKANGTAIIETMKVEIHGIIAINPQGSKISRVVTASPRIEAGNVFIPDPKTYPWVSEDFLPEVTGFPTRKNDDQVDALSQYINRRRDKRVGKIVEEDYQDEEISSNPFSNSLTSGMDC